MGRVLVVGATGNVGRAVVTQLAAAGAPVRALSRRPDYAEPTAGVEWVQGDLTVPESLDGCLDGIDTVFLVWTAGAEAVGPALERLAANARRIVFLTAPLKTEHPFFQQPNASRGLAQRVDEGIERLANEWTFLRAGIFALNSVRWWAELIRAGAPVRWPHLSAATAPVDERDLAAVAVKALCEEGHAGAQYVLTGPKSLTQAEQIRTICEVVGKPARMVELSGEEARQELLSIMPAGVIGFLLDAWKAADRHPALVTHTIEEVLGRRAHSFREWAEEHAREFRGG